MPLRFHPPNGAIIRCNFEGLVVPEMVKIRPVIVVSPRPQRAHGGLCTVVALSTTAPARPEPHQILLRLPGELPGWMEREAWLKGDMIYRMRFARLDYYALGKDREGRRQYYQGRFDAAEMTRIRRAVGRFLGLTP